MAEIPHPRIVVVRGGQALAEHELPPDAEIVVGRTPQCQVMVNDSTVSRMHARIFTDGQGVYVEDLGSANGTFVDGERVMGVVKLADGQQVRPGQKSVASPTVLRFEDPTKRLLAEMGLLSGGRESGATAAGDAETLPPRLPGSGTSSLPARKPAAAPAAVVAGSTAAVADPEAAAAAVEEAPPPRRRRFPPLLLAAGILGLLTLALFFGWLVRVMKPSSPQWRTVELSSYDVAPGAEMLLKSSEIQMAQNLEVRFAGQPVKGVEVVPGRLRFSVPLLGNRPPGSYPVPLAVRQGDLEVFAATLHYTVRPRVDRVQPTVLRVGDTVTLTGMALPDSPHDVDVTIGSEHAQILEATPSRLLVRVPLVTRQDVVQLPIVLRAGDWEARPDVVLQIAPKLQNPLVLDIQAAYHPDLRAWQLATPLGPLALVHGDPPGAGGAAPAAIQQLQQRLRGLVSHATDDRDLRVEAAPASGGYELREAGPNRRPGVVATLSEADLNATAAANHLETSPDMLAFWMARVWNHLLDTFARGTKPQAAPGGPAYVPVLAHLVDLDLAAGGTGRPEAADLERLPPAERQALAAAFLSVPAGYGTVTGHWTARLQNVFYPQDEYVIQLETDLRQNGRALSVQGQVLIQGRAMTFKVPATAGSGAIKPGMPLGLHLHFPFARPIGELDLDGTFEGGALGGTFKSSLAKQGGTWQAVRQ